MVPVLRHHGSWLRFWKIFRHRMEQSVFRRHCILISRSLRLIDLDYEVRSACEQDAEGIVALLNPIIRAGIFTVMDEEVTVTEQRKFIREFPERGVLSVAVRKDGSVLAMQELFPLPPVNAWEHV